MYALLMLLAILPGLLLCYLIYRLDKYEKEPVLVLGICFVLGMVITFPALQLETMAANYGIDETKNIGLLLVSSFLVVAFSEELVKFAVLMLYPYQQKVFNEPLDGIVYSVVIAMGFATVENVIYANLFGLPTTFLRSFTAVPAHAVFAVIMGYYVGLAKFDKNRQYQLIATGFGGAVIIHGIYDFFILQEYYEWLMLFATLTLVISGYFAFKLIKLHRSNSPFKNSLPASTENPVESIVENITPVDKVETTQTTEELIELMKKSRIEKNPPAPKE
ncbi:MAG: PrsW family intramembrane metalloprotease [Saprospiraceae bacterium]